MKKTSFLIVIFTCSALGLLNSDDFGVKVRPLDEELVTVSAKEVVTTKISVRNHTSLKHEFESEVTLPKKWKLISVDFPFELSADQSKIKIISFFVPDSTKSGKYEIKYKVSGRRFPSLSDEIKIRVVVRDSVEFKNKKLKIDKE
ncbi:hypothetical protein H8E88_24255 [candidate division KSB1 bacterium]|nr:hypothetical protein [candidate division KSB1 bacterium]